MPETFEPRALDEMLEMAGGDRAFVAEVVDQYLADSTADIAALRTAGGADLKRVAHTLKSTSASVGAAALSAICLDIEQAAGAGSVDPSLISAAETEHAAARAALESYREAP